MRWLVRSLLTLLLLAAAAWAALQLSPRPPVWMLQGLFDRGAAAASQALEKHVPAGVQTSAGQPYVADGRTLSFDVHRPAPGSAASSGALPLVVWIHGGAFVSGRKEDVANYARIYAARGYVVASVDYTLAPDATHPAQVRQVDTAIAALLRDAARHGIDARRVVLAGDSAGAQIAAQLAAAVTSPPHARELGIAPSLAPAQLRGVLLFCGVYDLSMLNYDGALGPFLRAVAWSFTGRRDFRDAPAFAAASVLRHVTADFPPAFITAGNADPLLPQSRALAQRLQSLGVQVDSLFFPADLAPALGHEYQFDLDRPEGRQARDRAWSFLAQVVR